MSWKLTNNQLFMYRPHLEHIPTARIPDGYEELPGDLCPTDTWIDLLNKVFGDYSLERVRHLIHSDLWNPKRLKLVAFNGQLVALSMAWNEPGLWPDSGFVYWVAVLPEHQNKGLGTFVLTCVLEHFAAESLRDAVVYTETHRLPAVKLYLKCGFVPLVTNTSENEHHRWQEILEALGRRDLADVIRDDYSRLFGE